MFIDTHAHLDYLKKGSVESILNESKEANVHKVITIAVDPTNQNKVCELAAQFHNVFSTQGIHPHDAKDFNQSVKENILQNISNNELRKKLVAIGEVGLDYHYDYSPKDVQRKVFEEFLQMSIDCKLPIIIHSREAEDDTIDIIKNFLPQLKFGGLFHSFTSNNSLAEFALNNDFYLGFNGIVTFKKAENVREILSMTPLEKILIETDAPFLAPLPHRGVENHPMFIPYIARAIADHKKIDINQLEQITMENAYRLFSSCHLFLQ